jgi:MFS family permease
MTKSNLSSLPRNVWAVTLTSFLTDVSSEMLTSLVPLFLFNVLGARTNIIGLIEGVAETTAGLLKVFSGWLSDRLRQLMAVYGLYYGLTEGVAKAFVADLVPAEQRSAAYGIFSAAIGITAFPASLIAGVLWQGLAGWNGFGPSAPFYFGAALALLACALLLVALPKAATDIKVETATRPARG